MKTYIIEGGIGKAVCFSALIPELAKDEKIQVYTPYMEVFAGNPLVELVLDSNSIPIHDPRITSSEIIYREVYKSNFIKRKTHIIESMCHDYGIEYNSDMRPKLYTDRYESSDYPLPRSQYCIVQFTGGQSALTGGQGEYQSIEPGRNLDPYIGQQIIDGMKDKYPELTVIDFSLPNEPGYDGTVKELRPFAWYHEALKKANFFVGIDSSLNHFSASTGTPGVVIWPEAYKIKQFGYEYNVNLTMDLPNQIDADSVLNSLINQRR